MQLEKYIGELEEKLKRTEQALSISHRTTDNYREALEQIRDLGPFITPGIPDQAYVIAELALDPEGCADLARIPKP